MDENIEPAAVSTSVETTDTFVEIILDSDEKYFVNTKTLEIRHSDNEYRGYWTIPKKVDTPTIATHAIRGRVITLMTHSKSDSWSRVTTLAVSSKSNTGSV